MAFSIVRALITVVLILGSLLANANETCIKKLGGSTTQSRAPRSQYSFSEIQEFVRLNQILPAPLLETVSREVSLFKMDSEDMGNALFLAVLDKLGTQPSSRKDLLIKEFLSPIFEMYLDQFKEATHAQAPAPVTRVPNLYALNKLGFESDPYGMILWSKAHSLQFIEKISSVILNQNQIDLNAVNLALVQIGYVHSILNHQTKMTYAELKLASVEFLTSLELGHQFVPTIGEWDISNINAEWYLGTTVNMFPPKLNARIDVHGGLSTIDGLAHDHGHFFNLRLRALAAFLGVKNITHIRMDQTKVRYLDSLLRMVLSEALKTHHQNRSNLDSATLTNTIFFLIHQPEPLISLLTAIKNGNQNWEINSPQVVILAHEMRLHLEKHTEFYPNLGKRFDEFEITARYLIHLVGSSSKPIQNFLEKN